MSNEPGRAHSARSRAFWAVWSIIAAFGTYFCMYGYRKAFTVGKFEGEEFFGTDFKSVLVIAQVLGYTVSKFLGIKVVSEMPPVRRALAILVLIGIAEAALVLFGIIPRPWNLIALFINGLPLGMVFGLVLSFLEGRKLTEALSAGLCASFILAGGFVKSVGQWLLKDVGVSETWMPAAAGALFTLPLLIGVAMLTRIPPPTASDEQERASRGTMNARDRKALFLSLAPGLMMLVVMFVLLTVLRGLRDDFAPEMWKGLGVSDVPKAAFTQSELWVGLVCFGAGACFALVRNNRAAFFGSIATCIAGFLLLAGTLVAQKAGALSPMAFMVLIGLGMYIPYVVVHTTVFERLLAVTREKGNLAFLMYVADSTGYLGYVAIVFGKGALAKKSAFLGFFTVAAWASIAVSLVCLVGSWIYFARRNRSEFTQPASVAALELHQPPFRNDLMTFDMFVFDMAGTTVDDSGNSVAEALCAALGAAGVPTTHAQIDPVMGVPKPLAIRTLLREHRGVEPTDAEVTRVHADFQNRMVEYYRTNPAVKEIDGASDLFRTLKRNGIRVTLDTGFDRRILDTIVTRLGWKGLIDDSAASDEVSKGRPDPELIRVLMQRGGVTDPKRVAKFGDSQSDIEQGLAAGCGFVGAILTSRTRPIVHNYPDVKPMNSIAQALQVMEAAGCAPFPA